MPQDLVIRRASADEHADLAELRWQWRVTESAEEGQSPTEFQRAFIRWAGAHSGTHVPFLAAVHGRIVGMAWLAVLERIPGPGRWKRLAGHLQSVYVTPSHRKQGIGEALIRAVIAAASALELDYLVVHPSERSFGLYRRLGFAEGDQLLELRLAT